MIRFKFGAFLMVTALSLVPMAMPSPAAASSEGCPDTWVNPDLVAAKQRLGGNMVETQLGRKIVKYEGWDGGSYPDDNIVKAVGTEGFRFFVYLYGRSIAESQVKVEVKDCPRPGIFTSQSAVFGSDFEVVKMSAAEWAVQNPRAFTDFKMQESFAQSLATGRAKAQTTLDKYRNGQYLSPGGATLALLSSGGGLLRSGPTFHIASLTPKCLVPYLTRYVTLNFGGKCDFAWYIFETSSSKPRVVMFEPFTLDLTPTKGTIRCIKGKVVKKVSGINPKCPAGFKKK